MLIKFVRKYGFSVFFAVMLFASFLVGHGVGKAHCKKVPVFVEKTVYVENAVESVETVTAEPEYTEIELTATAYCPCEKCCGVWATKRPLDENGEPIVYTASGTVAKAGRTIAVDTSVFPYGTEIVIDGQTYVAEDCGGAIKGNRIDVYFDTHEAARKFGKQTLTARINN